jgi:hypothetical protein
MKNVFPIIFFALSMGLSAQKSKCKCEVFKTADDYKNSRAVEGRKIDWGIRFTWQGTEEVLKLKTSDSTIKYKAGTAFAFSDTDCDLYRYYKEDYFVQVLNKEPICLYTRTTHAIYKGMDMSNTTYYFSRDFYSPIIELTRKNLLNEYSDKPSFSAEIQKLKKDNDLMKIDKGSGKYKVAELYEQAK